MRNRFDQQLEQLNEELMDMGFLCKEAIMEVTGILLTHQEEQDWQRVTTLELEIDQKEKDIESLCMKLLMRQQPVARDLRQISSALKMISDMERIGDQAADIAEIVPYVTEEASSSKIHIGDMAEATIKMVTESIESFVNKDLVLAREVMKYDDVVDSLFNKVKEELIHLISEDKSNGEACIDLLMISKYFERIGDHAVNIAEWVEYSITGERVRAQ